LPKELLEVEKKQLVGDTVLQATSDYAKAMRAETAAFCSHLFSVAEERTHRERTMPSVSTEACRRGVDYVNMMIETVGSAPAYSLRH